MQCQQSSQPANATTADDATNATHTSTVSTMDIFPAHSSDTRATPHARDTRSHPQPDRDTDGTAACDTTAPVSANARSLFVQLSDAAAGNDAAKTALERTATPIVPRSAGPPPQMPMGVGATDAGGTHRTRSSSGGSRANRPTAQSLTPPLPAYRQHIGHAVRFYTIFLCDTECYGASCIGAIGLVGESRMCVMHAGAGDIAPETQERPAQQP